MQSDVWQGAQMWKYIENESGIRYIAGNIIKSPHGFFTRRGGVSTGIYSSLQCSVMTKHDTLANVEENRYRIMNALNAQGRSMVCLRQIHSGKAVCVDNSNLLDYQDKMEGDALVIGSPGIPLCIVTADCVPILIEDSSARLVGAVHAGWMGVISGIVENTITLMCDKGGTVSSLSVFIGPCIGHDSYEVSDDFKQRFLDKDSASAAFFSEIPLKNSSITFNLPGYVAHIFRKCGVNNIEVAEVDTYQDDNFFSNRRAFKRGEEDYGRFMSVIMSRDD